MNSLIDIVITEGFANENLMTEFKFESRAIESLRKELICSLNKRIELKNSIYEEMLIKERLVVQEIESILNHQVIKRASINESKGERIENILEPLVQGKVAVLKDYRLLVEIKNILLSIIDEQLYFEGTELQKIRDSIGEDMYNEYKVYFESNGFLKFICENDWDK